MPRQAFRMSLDDFALLDKFAKAAGISDAAYLRWLLRREAGSAAALPVPPKRKRTPEALLSPPTADPALLVQLAKVGNLLNQVARSANECRKNGSSLDLVQVLTVLLIIEHQSALLVRPALPISPKEIIP